MTHIVIASVLEYPFQMSAYWLRMNEFYMMDLPF